MVQDCKSSLITYLLWRRALTLLRLNVSWLNAMAPKSDVHLFWKGKNWTKMFVSCFTTSVTRLGNLLAFGNLFCPNLLHSQAIFVKVSKSLIYLVKSFWATFIDIWHLFTGHTGSDAHEMPDIANFIFWKQSLEFEDFDQARYWGLHFWREFFWLGQELKYCPFGRDNLWRRLRHGSFQY